MNGLMNRLLRLSRCLGALAAGIVFLTGWAASAGAAEPPEALMLVATPSLTDPLYGATVLVARPIGGGQFLGFILNKPTTLTVAEAFPAHAPSQKVTAPIFVGGPEQINTRFALVNNENSRVRARYAWRPTCFWCTPAPR